MSHSVLILIIFIQYIYIYIYIHDLKLFRGLMCCRSRNSCSRPRLSLVSWCRACGPIFGVLLVPFIALVPRFPWPSRSSFWAFFVVVVCVLGSCSGLTLSRCIPPHFILLHQPHLCLPWSTLVLPLAWATTAPTLRSPWKLAASGSLCLGLLLQCVTLSNTCRPISHVLGLLTPSTGSFEVISSRSPTWPPASSGLETRDPVLSSFSACPSHLRALGSKLVGASLSGAGRIDRAWTAGRWARAVSDSRVHSPNRTPPLDLRLWCVLTVWIVQPSSVPRRPIGVPLDPLRTALPSPRASELPQ